MGANQSLTGQVEDLVPGPAVGLRRGDDALCPQAARAQLVRAQARGQRVVAGSDPVAGGRGHDQADPAHTAGRGADDLSAPERHGPTGSERVKLGPNGFLMILLSPSLLDSKRRFL